jgi:hypothetical protein
VRVTGGRAPACKALSSLGGGRHWRRGDASAGGTWHGMRRARGRAAPGSSGSAPLRWPRLCRWPVGGGAARALAGVACIGGERAARVRHRAEAGERR